METLNRRYYCLSQTYAVTYVIPRVSDHVNMHNFTMHLSTPWEDKACSKS